MSSWLTSRREPSTLMMACRQVAGTLTSSCNSALRFQHCCKRFAGCCRLSSWLGKVRAAKEAVLRLQHSTCGRQLAQRDASQRTEGAVPEATAGDGETRASSVHHHRKSLQKVPGT